MIKVSCLQKKYGDIRALEDVSLTVETGQIVGFVGPNGSGKSTTLRIIAGLEKADSGNCTVDGVEAGKLADPWSKLATLLDRQGVNGELTAMHAMSALGAAYGVPSERIMSLIGTVGLDHARHRRVKSFSLGMKQRLNIALALLAEPSYLILDEPMNGLDPDGILWLRDFLSNYRNQGGGVLLSSHTLSEVEIISDVFVIIKNGQTVWTGTKEKLVSGTTTHVTAQQQSVLVDALKRLDYAFEIVANGIFVKEVSPVVLGPKLVNLGVPITCLKEVDRSLEDVYLSFSSEGGK